MCAKLDVSTIFGSRTTWEFSLNGLERFNLSMIMVYSLDFTDSECLQSAVYIIYFELSWGWNYMEHWNNLRTITQTEPIKKIAQVCMPLSASKILKTNIRINSYLRCCYVCFKFTSTFIYPHINSPVYFLCHVFYYFFSINQNYFGSSLCITLQNARGK